MNNMAAHFPKLAALVELHRLVEFNPLIAPDQEPLQLRDVLLRQRVARRHVLRQRTLDVEGPMNWCDFFGRTLPGVEVDGDRLPGKMTAVLGKVDPRKSV